VQQAGKARRDGKKDQHAHEENARRGQSKELVIRHDGHPLRGFFAREKTRFGFERFLPELEDEGKRRGKSIQMRHGRAFPGRPVHAGTALRGCMGRKMNRE
jgi:hypothetical protein